MMRKLLILENYIDKNVLAIGTSQTIVNNSLVFSKLYIHEIS